MSCQSVDIEYSNNPAVYHEGDRLGGHVKVESKEDLKVKAIRVEFFGVASVYWKERDNESQVDIDVKTAKNCNKETYFKHTITLARKDSEVIDKDGRLAAGQHILPFEYKLPLELPSSFEGLYGQIRYWGKASVERAWKTDLVTKKAFTILSGLDLNFIPEAAAKIEICKYKEFGGMCCNTGSVTVDWSVDRSGFVPGQNINISGAVQNESAETVSNSSAALIMIVDYKTKKGKRREYRTVASVDKGDTAPGDVTVWQEVLHIPPIPPTGYSRCHLVDINFELRFSLHIEDKPKPIIITKDVYIGTVPISRREMKSCIAGMFNQPFNGSMDMLPSPKEEGSMASLTCIIAQISTEEPTTEPSAPTFDTLERLDYADPSSVTSEYEDRPPPFAPQSPAVLESDGQSMTVAVQMSPTAPSAFTLQRPWSNETGGSMQATYEESMFGAVNIQDADDTESLRGDMSYAPVYTYYTLGGTRRT